MAIMAIEPILGEVGGEAAAGEAGAGAGGGGLGGMTSRINPLMQGGKLFSKLTPGSGQPSTSDRIAQLHSALSPHQFT